MKGDGMRFRDTQSQSAWHGTARRACIRAGLNMCPGLTSHTCSKVFDVRSVWDK